MSSFFLLSFDYRSNDLPENTVSIHLFEYSGLFRYPQQGAYFFQGIEVGRLSRNQRARLRRHYLGFVFQGFNLLNRTSALENVELPLIYRGISAAVRHAWARNALAAVGLNG
ncbi:hypothetical protein [Nitrosococcus wardiae]|uniref:hypothetical protein n=1 Tax=Nitrosococcus wardiae TaxID=1814290 RepID=UPI001F0F43C8|nr:hypothetical protein [Nitrosococcus wardiae]